MEFIDLKSQYSVIEDSVKERIQQVLDHGKYIMGPEVEELENRLAVFSGVKHCISCANGTDALQMVLMAWGVGPGDAVFVPSFTFMSTAEVVRLVGAVPIFVDCDGRTFNINPQHLREAIEGVRQRGVLIPKVVIPVDLFGLIADYDAIELVAMEYGLKVLEDAAQSFGASVNGRMAASFGHAATTSFFPAKPLGCYGDGGAIFTNDQELASLLKSIRVHGQGSDKYDNVRIGLNARLDTLQAAILLAKLDVFPEEIKARQLIVENYKAALMRSIRLPLIPEGSVSAWAQYSVLAQSEAHRTKLMEALKQAGIPTMVYYRKPLHMQTAFEDGREHQGSYPVSENIASRIFSLPMHPFLEQQDIESIAAVINSVEA